MQLTVINASPRRAGSNTRRVLEPFLEGFGSVPGATARCCYVHEVATGERVRELFLGSEALLLAFPLYCYALPPAAERFVYALEPLRGRGGASLAFLCQFGFREACHARALERQLAGVCTELGVENLGMVIRGGCEGLSLKPLEARLGIAAANLVFWRAQLKRHGALERNWARPLLTEEEGRR